MKAFNGFVMTQ